MQKVWCAFFKKKALMTPKLSIRHQLTMTHTHTHHIIYNHIHIIHVTLARYIKSVSPLLQSMTDFDTISIVKWSNGQAERRQVSELSSALERLQQEQLGQASEISTFLEMTAVKSFQSKTTDKQIAIPIQTL